MRLLERFTQGRLHLTRTEAFSDAVFAIVVTLLVLELKVPTLRHHASPADLAHHLVELLPKFMSWLISFIIVCKFWINHHHLLGLARHADYAMLWLNAIFLMGQSFIPFPTALVGEYPTNPLAVSLFGCVFAINTLLFLALQAYIVKNLIKPELAAEQDPHGLRKGFVGPASYLAGAAVAWISVHAAFVIYALTPLFYLTPRQWRRPAASADSA
jgi:TMEM175 potassium channel family protein